MPAPREVAVGKCMALFNTDEYIFCDTGEYILLAETVFIMKEKMKFVTENRGNA